MSIPIPMAVVSRAILTFLAVVPSPASSLEATVQSILEKAFQAVRSLPEDKRERAGRDVLLGKIAEAQVEHGDRERGLQTAESIHDTHQFEYVRARCEFKAAAYEARSGHRDACSELLKRGADHTEAISHKKPWEQGRLLSLKAGVEMMMGDRAACDATLREARETLDPFVQFVSTRIDNIEGDARDYAESFGASIVSGEWESLGGVAFLLRLDEPAAGKSPIVPDGLLLRLALERARTGKQKEALEALERMIDPGSQVRAFVDVATVQADAGEASAARDNLKIAYQRIGADGNVHSRNILATRIARTRARIGDREEALAILEQVRPAGERGPFSDPAYLASFAVALREAGEKEQAEEWLGLALRRADAIVNEDSRENALLSVAMAYAQTGKLEEASRIAARIGEGLRNYLLPQIALEWARTGELDKAARMVEQITTERPRTKSLRQIAHTLAASGRLPLALAWSEQQKSPLHRGWTFFEAARGLHEHEASRIRHP